MKAKQINAALRRVEVPHLVTAHRESFTAGVRAMAYALEVDTTNENVLKTALEYYADPSIYVTGDAPGHIYAIADDGATARQALQTRGESAFDRAVMGAAGVCLDLDDKLSDMAPEPAFAKAVQVGNTRTVMEAASLWNGDYRNIPDGLAAELDLPDQPPAVPDHIAEAFNLDTDDVADEIAKQPPGRVEQAPDDTAFAESGPDADTFAAGAAAVVEQAEPTFTQQLTDMLNAVYNNEEAFIAKFLPDDAVSVDDWQMNAAYCTVRYNATIITTIKTADFIEWTTTLRGAK